MTLSKYSFLIITLALICTGVQAQSVVTSDFASNADGWTSADALGGSFAYSSTGGNPNGYIQGQTANSIILGATRLWYPFYFTAPGKFNGNRSAYYGGGISFDVSQTSTAVLTGFPAVILSTAAGVTIYYFPNTPFAPATNGSWTNFEVPLTASTGEWKTTNSSTGPAASQAQIQTVLTGLTSLQIQGLYRNANLVGKLDNVNLRPPLTVTTQPTSTAVCEDQTATFTAVGGSNPTITYHWQKFTPGVGFVDISNGGGYSNVTTSTVSINTTGNFGAGTYRARISGIGGVDDTFSNSATLTVNARPAAVTASGAARCGPGTIGLTASGGTQYRWYTVATNGTPIVGATTATYTTPSLTTTTNYYVANYNGTCESSTRATATATINTIPTPPTTTGAQRCGTGTLTLKAAGGSNGQYRWYTVASNGLPISGQTSDTYTTPSLNVTTNYYVALNNVVCESTRTAVKATVGVTPPAPYSTTGATACAPASVTLTARGGSQGEFRWYTVSTGGTAIAGAIDSTYVTPVLSANTTYFVSLFNGCEGARTDVTATLNTPPTAPTVTGDISCVPKIFTLKASGGKIGQYRWYTVATGGAFAPNNLGDTFQTPELSATTTYYVSINDGTCESARVPVKATIGGANCTNNTPPVIKATEAATTIGGTVTINVVSLLSDADNNLDLSTLSIVTPPSSGAAASFDSNHNLVINYAGRSFNGTENITISVCDSFGACAQQALTIDVSAAIEVFNAMSPNSDGKNDVFYIKNIDKLDNTKNNRVAIFNRWGDLVWEGTNYDNAKVVFAGLSKNNAELPSGTYYYKIEYSGKTDTGYLVLKR